MPRYLISYIGGDRPASPEEGKRHFERYQQWLTALGEAAESPMNPLKNSHAVGPDGTVRSGGVTSMSGFTIVRAESMDDALEMAAACPFLEINGTLEVSELVQMG